MIVQQRERPGRPLRPREGFLFGASPLPSGMANAPPAWTPTQFGANLKIWARQGLNVTSAGFPSKISAWGEAGYQSLLQGSGSAQPIELPWSGTNYLWLPGVDGNTASTPNAAALQIVGNLAVEVYIALDDFTPAAVSATLTMDGEAPGTRSWQFNVQTNGTIRLAWSTDGTNFKNATSSIAPTVSDGDFIWLCAELNVATGDVTFYTSSDGVTRTPLGTVASTAAGALFAATSALVVGAKAGGTLNTASGKVRRARVYSGNFASGTLVFDANFAAQAEGTTSFTESSSNAATVTINRTGTKQSRLIGSWQALSDGAAFFVATGAFTFNQPSWIAARVARVTAIAGAYWWDGATIDTGVVEAGTPATTIDMYAGAGPVGSQAAPALLTFKSITAGYNAASSFLKVSGTAAVTGNAGSANMGGFTFACSGGSTNFSNLLVKEILGGIGALSAADVSNLENYLGALP